VERTFGRRAVRVQQYRSLALALRLRTCRYEKRTRGDRGYISGRHGVIFHVVHIDTTRRLPRDLEQRLTCELDAERRRELCDRIGSAARRWILDERASRWRVALWGRSIGAVRPASVARGQ